MSRTSVLFLLGLTACAMPRHETRVAESKPSPEATIAHTTLVTAAWLSDHLDDPDLVVLDCSVHVEMEPEFRLASGRADYEAGHIPTAGFADLLVGLSDADSPLQFALPSPEQLATAMGALGVGDDSRVVLYSANRPGWAARVWWMLRWIGFDRAALLDGGLPAWTAEGRPLEKGPVERAARQLTVSVRPELIAGRDEVIAAIDDPAVRLIDALPEASYRGEMPMYNDRGGHIPSATSLPAESLLDSSGRYKPPRELAAMVEGDRSGRVITYCGGGIAASSEAFALIQIGHTDVAVYVASLQEWAADPKNPLTTDAP